MTDKPLPSFWTGNILSHPVLADTQRCSGELKGKDLASGDCRAVRAVIAVSRKIRAFQTYLCTFVPAVVSTVPAEPFGACKQFPGQSVHPKTLGSCRIKERISTDVDADTLWVLQCSTQTRYAQLQGKLAETVPGPGPCRSSSARIYSKSHGQPKLPSVSAPLS